MRFVVYLSVLLFVACAKQPVVENPTAATEDPAQAQEPTTSPPTASTEEAPATSEQSLATIAEQPEAAPEPAAQEPTGTASEVPTEPTPEAEKPVCSEEADHTLNLSSLRITKGVDGMTPISWVYRDVSFVDGSKHEVTCLSTVETTCVFGDCTNFTKCCDRGPYEPPTEPQQPQPDPNTIANQEPSS